MVDSDNTSEGIGTAPILIWEDSGKMRPFFHPITQRILLEVNNNAARGSTWTEARS